MSKEDVLHLLGEPLGKSTVGETTIAYYTRSQVLEGNEKKVSKTEEPEALFRKQSGSSVKLFFDSAGNLTSASPEMGDIVKVGMSLNECSHILGTAMEVRRSPPEERWGYTRPNNDSGDYKIRCVVFDEVGKVKQKIEEYYWD